MLINNVILNGRWLQDRKRCPSWAGQTHTDSYGERWNRWECKNAKVRLSHIIKAKSGQWAKFVKGCLRK